MTNRPIRPGRIAVITLTMVVIIGIAALVLYKMGKAVKMDWQERLTRYVDLLNQDDGRITTIQQTVHARAPERFRAEMSSSSWGDGHHFAPHSSQVDPSALLPLPFPPQDLWCALLTHKYTTDPALNVPNERRIVLVAQHSDLHHTEWVVHTLPGLFGSPATQQILVAVGCSFDE